MLTSSRGCSVHAAAGLIVRERSEQRSTRMIHEAPVGVRWKSKARMSLAHGFYFHVAPTHAGVGLDTRASAF